MEGNPAQFEAIGSRLGFRIDAEDAEGLTLVWQGVRFPAFLCLGIAVALLVLSVPIAMAIQQRGWTGPAGSLWYFPVMNLILFGVALYLLSLKRTIVLNPKERQIRLVKRTALRRIRLCVDYAEVVSLRLGTDQVNSGLAVASTAPNETYPVPSLRLTLTGGNTVLLDRSSRRKLESLGQRLSQGLGKPLERDESFIRLHLSRPRGRD